MNEHEKILLDLLRDVTNIERRCKFAKAAVAVPPVMYRLFDELRGEIAKWGIENLNAMKEEVQP